MIADFQTESDVRILLEDVVHCTSVSIIIIVII